MSTEKGNAALAGDRDGAENKKAAKLSPTIYSQNAPQATFFWDARSNSVESLTMRQAVPA